MVVIFFFGEPAFDVLELTKHNGGPAPVHILAASKLYQRPRLYAAVLLWLLSELFENLPEAGDLPQPKLVLFLDEAHLLFDNAPNILVDKIEHAVRLIRSKSVGVYFCTQSPLDIPESVLGQLGNRFQHALRAFTPKDQKAVRAAADTFRANPNFDTAGVITQLGVGEVLTSTLDDKGAPTPVDRAKINLPLSRVAPLAAIERAQVMAASPYAGVYDTAVDRESAFETLATKKDIAAEKSLPERPQKKITSQRQGTGEALVKSVVRAAGSRVGREIGSRIVRGLLGAVLK